MRERSNLGLDDAAIMALRRKIQGFLVNRGVSDPDVRDDLIQEAFAKVLAWWAGRDRTQSSVDDGSPPESSAAPVCIHSDRWIIKTIWKAIKHLLAENRRSRARRPIQFALNDDVLSDATDGEKNAEREAINDSMAQALSTLPPDERRLMDRVFFRFEPRHLIAESLHVCPGELSRRIKRICDRLRRTSALQSLIPG